jgi:hypothetical protein
VWFLDIDELNPHGRRLFPDFIPALVKEFDFSVFPETPAQMEPTSKTGIAFKNGKFPISDGSVVALNFEIHTSGLAVETRDSTDASEHILD